MPWWTDFSNFFLGSFFFFFFLGSCPLSNLSLCLCFCESMFERETFFFFFIKIVWPWIP